ncbi:hypothetical protein HB943_04440 [Listeria weihenstephanensis]|uniref:Uncharacterized protein n=1 Tax=Listeria weihenstephanensis TaxID=1006155 RepID=A0A841Z5B4_9LIST|nr:hypothetical protein [Listeria weihenstephanensis]MBC1499842.1 hypothetical protein [Listeria weihenstephanensis]
MRRRFSLILIVGLLFLMTSCSTAPNGLNDNKSASPDKEADKIATQAIEGVFNGDLSEYIKLDAKTEIPTYKSSYKEVLDSKDYLYGAYYQKNKICYLFTFIDNEKPEKLELTLQKKDGSWQLIALTPWDTKGTDLTEKEIYNKIGKGTGDDIRIFERGATFMRI